MPFAIAGLSIFVAAAIYGLFINSEPSVWRSFWKTAPAVLMAGVAVIFGGPALLILALLLSAVGDYFLSFEDKFVPGLLAFLSGHVAYIMLFWQLADGAAFTWLVLFILLYSAGFAFYLWGKTHKYRWPVLVYIGVIAAMAGTALSLPAKHILATLGAVIFVLSDTVLAVRMFVVTHGKTRAVLSWVVWVSYILGQALILFGLVA